MMNTRAEEKKPSHLCQFIEVFAVKSLYIAIGHKNSLVHRQTDRQTVLMNYFSMSGTKLHIDVPSWFGK